MSRDAEKDPEVPPALLPADAGNRAPIGQRIQGRYRITGELGTGAFGPVYLAEDEATGHPVAIRLPPHAPAGSLHAAQSIQRMGQSIVAASTAHPGLARVLEFGELEPGRRFAAVELVEGRRLSEILSEGKALDVGVVLRLALELGGAVETLHNMGLVHGTLRPRNVMVLADGSVKLMDVELIGLRTASATTVLAAEPPAEYLSPEQVRRAPLAEGTDIYAFAAILYEMLCGVPPLQATTRKALLAKQLTSTPVPVRRRRRAVPAPIESVVALALSKEPERRPPMQTILNVLWEEANTPPTRWKRTAAIMGGAVLAGSIAGLGAWSFYAPRPSAPPPLAQPAPSAAATPEPVSAPPTASAPPAVSAPAIETPPAPVVKPATPPVVRSASPLPTPPAKVERREPPRPAQTPASAPLPPRPASPNGAEGDDAGAVIDWLLKRSPARGQ